MPAQDLLSLAFAALADPTRRDIIVRLRRGPQTVSALAAHYPMSRPAVSQHLTVLEKAGMVSRGRRAQWHDCSLTTTSMDEAASWIAAQRVEWTDRLDRLDQHLARRRSPRPGRATKRSNP